MVTNTYPTVDRPYAGAAVYVQETGLQKLGVDISILLLGRELNGPQVYLKCRELIKKTFQEGNFDLIHVQFGGLQALQAVRALRRRVIITFHGTDLHGGLPKTISQYIRYKIGTWCSRWAAKHGGWSIVVSENLSQYLVHVTNCYSVIPTGVDFEQFKPIPKVECIKKLCLDPNKKYILFCDSGHDPVKRRDLANLVLAKARQEIENLEFLELHHVPHKEVPLYLNASDCLLVTSDKEGSPNIIKEALACNTPILSVDVGDVALRIREVKNCEIVSRDVPQITKSLCKIILNNSRSNGREMTRESIDNDIICHKILSIYEKVVSIRLL